jgi:hypothetical protein
MSYKPVGQGTICRHRQRDYDDPYVSVKENGMSMQSEGKDAKGRNYDQATKDGTSSAGSVGTGGTGDIGRMSGETDAGNAQSETRTDDWLSRGTEDEREQGFKPSDPGAIKTGMEGIADAGNRQSNDKGRKP